MFMGLGRAFRFVVGVDVGKYNQNVFSIAFMMGGKGNVPKAFNSYLIFKSSIFLSYRLLLCTYKS